VPKYKVTAPDGRTLVLSGDKPPTQADLNDIFAHRQTNIPDAEQFQMPGFLDTLSGEVSGGLGQMASQFDVAPPPDSFMGKVREAVAPPPAILGALRVMAAPATAAGKALGGTVLEQTGSPVAAGVADAITQVLSGSMFGKALGGALPAAAKRLPGAQAGLRELALEDARALPIKYAPAPNEVSQLYDEAALHNPIIPLPKLTQMARDIQTNETVMGRLGAGDSKIATIAAKIGATPTGELPFQTIRQYQARLGDMMHDAQMSNDSVQAGSLKRLYGALAQDISDAPMTVGDAGPAVEALTKAKYAARREFASQELGDIIEGAVSPGPQGSPIPEQARFQSMLKAFDKKVKTDSRFAGSFTKTELGDIRQTLEQFRQLKPIPPPSGVNFGSGRIAANAGISYGLAHILGIPPAYAIGGGFALEKGLTNALMSQPGRLALRSFLRNPQAFVPGASAASGAAVPAASKVFEEIAPAEQMPNSLLATP
jgi:hypothetical protein